MTNPDTTETVGEEAEEKGEGQPIQRIPKMKFGNCDHCGRYADCIEIPITIKFKGAIDSSDVILICFDCILGHKKAVITKYRKEIIDDFIRDSQTEKTTEKTKEEIVSEIELEIG